jgi:hypothetical protein
MARRERDAPVKKATVPPRVSVLPLPKRSKPPEPYTTETVAIADLRPHPRNYKAHPEDQLAHIAESLKQFGVYRNVVVAKDGTILAGHGVVEAAKLVGFTTLPVKRMKLAADDPRAMKILALDNEVGKFGETDDRKLSEILREIRDQDAVGLLGTGYDDQSLAAFLMVTRPASEIKSTDEAAEWVGMPEYDPGEVQFKLVVTFKNEADRKAFADKHALTIDKMERVTWSTRWPFTRREDAHSIRFESAAKSST